MALEIAKSGIRVNGVAPGPTDTGMLTRFTGTPENKAALVTDVPMGRLGLSEELANAIVFIASDEASFITGHILNVDGGHNRRLKAIPVHASSTWIAARESKTINKFITSTRPRRRSSSRPTESASPIAASAKPAACLSSSTSTTRAPWITGTRR